MTKIKFNGKTKEITQAEPCFASREEVITELEKLIKKKYVVIYGIIDRFIYSRTGNNNVNGYTAKDIVSIACWKFIDEKIPHKRRRWNKTKYPDFEKAFMNACFSLISNEIKKFHRDNREKDYKMEETKIKDNNDEMDEEKFEFSKELEDNMETSETDFDDEGNKESFKKEYYDISESLSVQRKIYLDYQTEYYSEKEDLSEHETEKIIEVTRNKLMELDENMVKVFDAILEGERKDKELAEKFNLPIEIVRYYKKRIKYYTSKILGELKNERKIS